MRTKLTINDLEGLTPIEQGKRVFGSENAGIAMTLENLWPENSPQNELFSDLFLGSEEFKTYQPLANHSLYNAAMNMREACQRIVNSVCNEEVADLQLTYLRDILSVEKKIRKDKVDKPIFYNSAFSVASRCYADIAAVAVPSLKIQKIRFKGARKVSNIDSLTNSIVAHQMIYNTSELFGDTRIQDLTESAECFPSYIAELYEVNIKDIKNKEIFVPKIIDGNIILTSLNEVLDCYEDAQSNKLVKKLKVIAA